MQGEGGGPSGGDVEMQKSHDSHAEHHESKLSHFAHSLHVPHMPHLHLHTHHEPAAVAQVQNGGTVLMVKEKPKSKSTSIHDVFMIDKNKSLFPSTWLVPQKFIMEKKDIQVRCILK